MNKMSVSSRFTTLLLFACLQNSIYISDWLSIKYLLHAVGLLEKENMCIAWFMMMVFSHLCLYNNTKHANLIVLVWSAVCKNLWGQWRQRMYDVPFWYVACHVLYIYAMFHIFLPCFIYLCHVLHIFMRCFIYLCHVLYIYVMFYIFMPSFIYLCQF